MFTGIIETTGEVMSLAAATGGDAGANGMPRLTVRAGAISSRLNVGDSVAVSGVCLTALEMGADWFATDLAAETIARTTLSGLHAGAVVNLELPTPAGAPLGGHVVQGHVDGVATVTGLEKVAGAKDWVLRLRLPEEMHRYVVAKGSIAVEGISLTVAGAAGDGIWIAVLPHTYSATNVHTLKVGAGVNIEVDVLAKYAERRAEGGKRELTVEYLLANGY